MRKISENIWKMCEKRPDVVRKMCKISRFVVRFLCITSITLFISASFFFCCLILPIILLLGMMAL